MLSGVMPPDISICMCLFWFRIICAIVCACCGVRLSSMMMSTLAFAAVKASFLFSTSTVIGLWCGLWVVIFSSAFCSDPICLMWLSFIINASKSPFR